MLEVKQLQVPLETKLDRIGSAKLTANRVIFDTPLVQSEPVSVASAALDQFAPRHLQQLSDEEQLSSPAFVTMPAGMRLAATEAPVSGPATEWDTGFRTRDSPATSSAARGNLQRPDDECVAARGRRCSVATRLNRNPYAGDPNRSSYAIPACAKCGNGRTSAVAQAITFTAAAEVRRFRRTRSRTPSLGRLMKTTLFVKDAFNIGPSIVYAEENIQLGAYTFLPWVLGHGTRCDGAKSGGG